MPVDHLPTEAPSPRIIVPLALSDHDASVVRMKKATAADPERVVAPAIGPDWVLAEICVRRLIDAGAHQSDTIVLGVQGSDDVAELADYARAAQLVSAVWGGPVSLGSLSGSDVLIADALDVARARGRRVVLASYLLAPGPAWIAMRQAGADLVTAPILDGGTPDPRIVELVLDRGRQATRQLTQAS